MYGTTLSLLGALAAVLTGAVLFGRLVDRMVAGTPEAASGGPDGLEAEAVLELNPPPASGSSTRDG